MTRRRSLKLLSALAAASIVVAACSGDDDDDAVSGDTTAESAAAAPTTEATEGTDGTDTTEATDGTTEDTTEGTDGRAAGCRERRCRVGGSGCGIPHGPYEDSGEEPAGEVRVAWNDPLLSFNSNTTRGNAAANTNPSYLMGLGNGGGFTYYDQDLNLINNDSFGTCTIESLDPLTVTYRINEGVTWSDGVQIDAADLLLQWAGKSTFYNDENTVVAETASRPRSTPTATRSSSTPPAPSCRPTRRSTPEGALLEGNTYKESAGVNFDAVEPGWLPITSVPEISEDGLAVTATWDEFYVDYQVAADRRRRPGARRGPATPSASRTRRRPRRPSSTRCRTTTPPAVKPIAEFWNTGFDATSLPSDPGLYLSAGPYVLTSYDELSQMTFEINEIYDWGPKPKVATIVYRIIGDPTAAVQAMENEEIDIIQPQATADILTQLEALADRGVEVEGGDTGTYEHVDLVFNNGGPFDPATYGGDEATALAVRQAFLKTIPRQEIVDRLIVPLNPDAELRDSFTTVPGAPTYDGIVGRERLGRLRRGRHRGRHRAARGGRRHDADRRAVPLRRQQPAAGQRVRADPRLGAPGRLQRHRRQQPDLGPGAPEHRHSTTPRCSAGSRRRSTSPTPNANFVTDRTEQLRRLLQRRRRRGVRSELQSSPDLTPDEQEALLLEIEQNLWADAFGVTHLPAPGRHGVEQHVREQRLGDHAVADDLLELLGVGSRLIGDRRSRHARE